MSNQERKQKTLQKFNIIMAIVMMLALFLFANSSILFSQTFKEVNFPDGSIAGKESSVKLHINYRIYQISANVIKFDLPEVSFVKVGIYDKNKNLVRTYIYNNLQAGTYEININSANMEKGNYTCVLSAADVEESSQVIIE